MQRSDSGPSHLRAIGVINDVRLVLPEPDRRWLGWYEPRRSRVRETRFYLSIIEKRLSIDKRGRDEYTGGQGG